MADLKGLRFDPQTIILLLIIIALLGAGYLFGHYKGETSVQNQIVSQGSQVSFAGVVESTNDNGFTVKVDNSVTGTSGVSVGTTGTSGQAATGTWTVKYGKGGANVTSSTGGTTGAQALKKGDKVQVSGTPIGSHTIVSQTVSKILPPTPTPKPAAPVK